MQTICKYFLMEKSPHTNHSTWSPECLLMSSRQPGTNKSITAKSYWEYVVVFAKVQGPVNV